MDSSHGLQSFRSGFTIPARKPAPVCAPFSGLPVWNFISCQEPAWPLHGMQLLLGHIYLLWHWILHDFQGGYLLHWDSPWASRHNLLCHSLLPRLLGNLCSSTWRTSSFFFTGLAIWSFSHICSQLQHSFLTYVSPELPPALLVALALAGWNCICLTRGSSSHKACLQLPLPTKAMPCKLWW